MKKSEKLGFDFKEEEIQEKSGFVMLVLCAIGFLFAGILAILESIFTAFKNNK